MSNRVTLPDAIKNRHPRHCSECGQLIPPRPIFGNASVKQRIFDFVAKHPEGVPAKLVFDHVWANDPDGGPLSQNTVAVHLKQMAPILAREGVAIRSSGGPFATYRLEDIEQSETKNPSAASNGARAKKGNDQCTPSITKSQRNNKHTAC